MSIATKSISSYLPIRARTNRTRSSIAFRSPCRWSACATTATSPNQGGVLGEFVGSTWMWTTGSVIFLFSLSHSFSSQEDTFLPSLPVFQGVLPLLAPSSLTRCVSRGRFEDLDRARFRHTSKARSKLAVVLTKQVLGCEPIRGRFSQLLRHPGI